MLQPDRSSVRTPAVAAALIAVATVAAYHGCFTGGFILDDLSSVTLNPSIRQLWPLTSPPPGTVTGGRPVANFTFALNYALSGLDVWSYHATNLLVHVLAALTLFGVVRRTLTQPILKARFSAIALPLAAAAALLWAVHPLQTATVDYVSQRTEQLMALFYLLTFYAFIRGTENSPRLWHPLAVVACTLGMASKEVMATAPVLILLYDRTFVAGNFLTALRQRWRLYAALASTWLLLAWLVLGSHLDQRGAGFNLGVSPTDYALTETRVLLHYLLLSLWPHPLVFDYGWDFARLLADVWPFVVTLTALATATLWALWRRPAIGFLVCWFFVIQLPTSSFVPISEQPMAESRVYLPLAAVAVALTAALFAYVRPRAILICGCVACLFVGLTARRTLDYHSDLSIWSDTVTKKPANARAHRALGDALLVLNRTDAAIASFATAVRLKPDYTQAHYNLGNAYLARGDRPAAIASFGTALRQNPQHAKAHNNLANALLAEKRPADAIPHYETALRLVPDFAEARRNLAIAYSDLGAAQLRSGSTAAAITAFRSAVRIAPDSSDAWHNLSRALLDQNDAPAAIVAAQNAVRLRADFPAAHINLGNAFFQAGDFTAAATAYQSALRLSPTNAEAHNNLGVIFLRAGRHAEARAEFSTALRLRPDYPDARANLAATPAPSTP